MSSYTIEPWDNEFSFEITTPDGRKYWVRLDEEWSEKSGIYNGICTCLDFETRCFPNFKKTREVLVRDDKLRTRCKHIRALVKRFHKLHKPKDKK